MVPKEGRREGAKVGDGTRDGGAADNMRGELGSDKGKFGLDSKDN